MSVNACWDYIVGFSRKEDLCVSEDWDDAYAISDSGLYIDELPGMPQRFIDSLGGNYDIWEKMENARENAINTFKVDVLSEILKYKERAQRRYIGDLGYKSFTNTLTKCTYQGLRMYSDIIGGEFILSGVWVLLDTTENIVLEIYDEYDLLYTIALTSSAGKPRYNSFTPIHLPLGTPTQQGYNYYFIYTSVGNAYNNKLTCNCSGFHWCFDLEHPCFKYSRDGWTEWAMVGGVCGNVLADRDDWGTHREAYGLVLHGEFTCDVIGTLCSDHADWFGNEVDLAIANAIWYKTGEFLATYVMDSDEVSRKTLLGVEQWNTNRTYYNARYVAMINFIAENLEDGRNECLVCKDFHGRAVRQQFL